MYILHIETSTKVCSVALSRNEDLLGWMDETEGMNHTAILAPMISRLLEKHSIKPRDLGAISVSSGPGSYTGLRVGSSTAKAMAYSLDIPLIGIPTLKALAWAAKNEYQHAAYLMPMLDARRNEVYTALYDRSLNELIPVSSLLVESENLEVLPGAGLIVCCGDGAFKMNGVHPALSGIKVDEEIKMTARHLVGPAWVELDEKRFEDPMHFVPFYLKPPNITQPRVLP